VLQYDRAKSQTKDDNLIKNKEIAKLNFIKSEPFLNKVLLATWEVEYGQRWVCFIL
jgi:hypothetical protein